MTIDEVNFNHWNCDTKNHWMLDSNQSLNFAQLFSGERKRVSSPLTIH